VILSAEVSERIRVSEKRGALIRGALADGSEELDIAFCSERSGLMSSYWAYSPDCLSSGLKSIKGSPEFRRMGEDSSLNKGL
jgi:hypothetical protein